MREIKFRAWSKEHDFIGKVYEIDFRYGLVKLETEKETTHTFGISNVELMQYTGLKDKSGKEIYEGDVVTTIHTDHAPHIGEVYFQPTRLNWSVKHGSLTNQDMFVYSRPDCSIEVIGNIYETPELLNPTDKD